MPRPAGSSISSRISVGNAARMVAIGCLWEGIRVFQQRKPPWSGRSRSPPAGWIVLCIIPPVAESLVARVVIVSLINGTFCLPRGA